MKITRLNEEKENLKKSLVKSVDESKSYLSLVQMKEDEND